MKRDVGLLIRNSIKLSSTLQDRCLLELRQRHRQPGLGLPEPLLRLQRHYDDLRRVGKGSHDKEVP